jgi:hypothetical protein
MANPIKEPVDIMVAAGGIYKPDENKILREARRNPN